ncbi:hypothetical protein [Anaerocolumna sp.]|uniref:hypothetical protein n=1 Tax=Anaerocolumna sp. TaxID=2041569 RepID=UPI0028B1E2D6|nr:hypothetical protein [Anaerocolumna sp.]
MIKWAKNLFLSENITPKKKAKIIKNIEKKNLLLEVYCITFASNPENLFDIMNANEFLFPYYSRKEIQILGIALSKKEAFELVKDMLEEIYRETGGFQVREYFKET